MHVLAKVLVASMLIFGAVFWALSGASSTEPYSDVHVVVADPDAHTDRTLSLRAIVVNNTTQSSETSVSFVVQDFATEYEHVHLPVVYKGTLPDAFGPKPVVLTGQLIETNGRWSLLAEDIQVGCSSKY